MGLWIVRARTAPSNLVVHPGHMTWTSKPRDYAEQALDALRRAEEAIDGQPDPGQVDELRTLVGRVEVALRTLADTVDTAAS